MLCHQGQIGAFSSPPPVTITASHGYLDIPTDLEAAGALKEGECYRGSVLFNCFSFPTNTLFCGDSPLAPIEMPLTAPALHNCSGREGTIVNQSGNLEERTEWTNYPSQNWLHFCSTPCFQKGHGIIIARHGWECSVKTYTYRASPVAQCLGTGPECFNT